ncbi:MAG: hypothetical protein SFX18_09835 [Pirellulales bacterium]|nr:hypothetical protein [Pirellulales bacterium]
MPSERVHTVDLLDQGIAALQKLGYQLRIEPELGQSSVCELKGKPWLILDPNQAPREQLHVVLDALRREPALGSRVALSAELLRTLQFQARAA